VPEPHAKGAGQVEAITHVGMDAHAATIHVAMLRPGQSQPLTWTVANTQARVRALAKRMRREATGSIRACYEAGPTGYQLLRWLEEEGVRCEVVAPSLIPVKPGDRIKTDRRDARKLAGLLQAGMLTPVRPPTPAEEGARDLTRRLQQAKSDRQALRNQLSKHLLLRGVRWLKKSWTKEHRAWIWKLEGDPIENVLLNDSRFALLQVEDRIQELEKHVKALSESEPYASRVGYLRCLKGVDVLTAMVLLTELHGIERFTSPRQLMAYLGLVPSERSSGAQERRGGITRAGNSRVRSLLIESAWHARHGLRPSKTLRARRRGQPAWVLEIAEKAERRLSQRHHHLSQKGKLSAKITVAVARESVGFIWDILTHQARGLA